MNIQLRLFIFVCGIMFSLIVLNLLIKKRISEKNSLVWFGLSLCIFILSAFPSIVDSAATLLGIDYPPTLLFLMSILVVIFMSLNHYIQLSVLNSRLKEMTQQVAIINFRLKSIENRLGYSEALDEDINNNIGKGNDGYE